MLDEEVVLLECSTELPVLLHPTSYLMSSLTIILITLRLVVLKCAFMSDEIALVEILLIVNPIS